MIFIDTGAFLARYLKRDQYHRQAIKSWQRIQATRVLCFTSNFVLDETLTLLARRADYEFAAERGRAFLSSSVLRILRPQLEDELKAVELYIKFADQKVSFTDCISFVLMIRHQLRKAFSFDSHFETAGFELWP